tara:strand:- start:4837 stop:5295 length:459 start_codon:yes stop_codon:yes gene_type:complete
MQELDKVLKNAIKDLDKEVKKKQTSKNDIETEGYLNPEFRTIYFKHSEIFGKKEEGARKPRNTLAERIIKPRSVSDFSPKYLAKLRALLPILKEADDITDKALLNKITAAGIDFKERQSVGNAIYNLVALGNVMVKMNGRIRESLTVLKSEL